MLEEYIKELRPIVSEIFGKDSSGHDISHLERTMKNALYIQKIEGGDPIIIGISAFLHDVHRIMQNETGNFVSPKDSLSLIRKILSNVKLTQEQIDKICYCIEYHEHYNWNENNVSDINVLILQDADNLDAIGAIGIGRAFAYGGSHNIPMYEDNKLLNSNNDYDESIGDKDTIIHHFYHKLFKLGDNMNTITAKEIAKKRINLMKTFTKEFINEWK